MSQRNMIDDLVCQIKKTKQNSPLSFFLIWQIAGDYLKIRYEIYVIDF